MPNATQLKPPNPGALAWGPAGSGKTALMMTLGKRAQLLSLDGLWNVANTFKDAHTKARQEVDIVECREDQDYPGNGLKKLKEHLFKVHDQCRQKTYPFDFVILDNLTELGSQAMRFILGNSGLMDHGIMRTGTPSAPLIQQAHWGLAMSEVDNVLHLCKSLPIGFFCIAHEFYVVEKVPSIDQKGKTVMVEEVKKNISIIGQKLAPKVPTYFNDIWYCNVFPGASGTINYRLQTKLTPGIQCARSSLGVPDGIEMSLGLPEILRRANSWPFQTEKTSTTTPTPTPMKG